MADLSVEYLGLKLKNPIIVSSSTLVQHTEGIVDAAKAGASAVVMRSLFEEIIKEETGHEQESMWSSHPEEYDYLMSELKMQYGTRTYLDTVQAAKAAVDIPIIASINCRTHKYWVDYVKQIESAGADAIELNLSLMPIDPGLSPLDIEEEFIAIVAAAREAVDIPLAVKIGPNFTSLSRFSNQLCGAGASALVLFNRFYQFDIDIHKKEIKGANWYSSPREMNHSLRWVAALYNRVNCDLAGNTGIHDGTGLIKQLLAGAKVVEVASTLYLNGFGQIQKMLDELEQWMKENHYGSLSEFRGMLSLSQLKDPEAFERLQYIKALSGIENK